MKTRIFAVALASAFMFLSCTTDVVDASKPTQRPQELNENKGQASSNWVARYGKDADACLVKAMYFEARGTGYKGMRAVGEVLLNRSDSGRFPKGVCNVLNQYYNGTCQFSFICDGIPDRYNEPEQKRKAEGIAQELLTNRGADITRGALFFHSTRMKPGRWFNSLHRIGTFGGNIFYK